MVYKQRESIDIPHTRKVSQDEIDIGGSFDKINPSINDASS